MKRRLESGQSVGLVMILGLVAVIVIAGILSLSFVRVGSVKAVTFAGGLTGTVFGEGLNIKAPWQGVRTVEVVRKSYETGSNPDTSDADFTDFQVEAQTSDGQQIRISYTVLFKVVPEDVACMFRENGSFTAAVENVVKANSRSTSRKRAQSFRAAVLYSGEGIQTYEDDVKGILNTSFQVGCVSLVDFLVRKIDFQDLYVAAIEAKQIANENIQTQAFNAQAATHERDRDITLAEGRKQDAILQAEAQARQITLLAEAQAAAITLQGAALEEYPAMIQWEFVGQLENVKWGFLPTDGVTPFIPLPTD